jgi:hypothetical protein
MVGCSGGGGSKDCTRDIDISVAKACLNSNFEVYNGPVHCSTALMIRSSCPEIQDVVERIEGLPKPPQCCVLPFL